MCRRRGAWLLRMPGADVLMAMPDRLRGARLKEKCEVSVESCVSGKPECANAANSEAACMQGGEARDFDWLSPNGIERHGTSTGSARTEWRSTRLRHDHPWPFALSLSKRMRRGTGLRRAQPERMGEARDFDELSSNGIERRGTSTGSVQTELRGTGLRQAQPERVGEARGFDELSPNGVGRRGTSTGSVRTGFRSAGLRQAQSGRIGSARWHQPMNL